MKNKQTKGLSLSLSANPEHLIKGTFFAATKVFSEFFDKIRKLFPRSLRGNNKLTGGTKPALIAPVILCRDAQSVHRILWQRISNLVKKFALLLKRSMFAQDSQDKPENDWCEGRWFGVYCKSVKHPSPADKSETSPSGGEVWHSTCRQKILGTRPRMTGARSEVKNNILHKGLDVVRQYAALLERGVQNSTRVRKAQVETRQANPLGRSMIEMLGVLAIIGVLSVGGIAGYSKAMTKWKINKTIEDYNYLFAGLIEHKDNFIRSCGGQRLYLAELVKTLNIVPQNWQEYTKVHILDPLGNRVVPYIGPTATGGYLVVDINLFSGLQKSSDYSQELCIALFRDVALNMYDSIHTVSPQNTSHSQGGKTAPYYITDCQRVGDSDHIYKCLRDITVAEITDSCRECLRNTAICNFVFRFK